MTVPAASPDPATVGLPKTMHALRLGAVFGFDRRTSLQAFDGLIKPGGSAVVVADAVAALRRAGHDPEAMRREISLSNPVAAMTLLVAGQVKRRISAKDLWARSGVSAGAVNLWLKGKAAPTLGRFVSYAAALGYSVFLVKSPGTGAPEADEICLSDQKAAMERLFAERTRIGMSIWDLEARSGISTKSLYCWKDGSRAPALGNLVALAETLGFEIVMRRA